MGRQQRRRQQQRQERREEQRAAKPQQKRGGGPLGPWEIAAGIGVLLIVVLVLVYEGTKGTASPASTPISAQAARPVDGISCSTGEQLAYHIHQHITFYDHGKQYPLPTGIGMPGGENSAPCYYWLHVHSFSPGILHVESPIQKTFHLGNFFDIWKKTAATANPPGDSYLLKLQAAARQGQVTAFLNGKRWTGSYRSIPLKEHGVITIEIGKPVVPPRPYTNWQGL